jgi:hypothetical protein
MFLDSHTVVIASAILLTCAKTFAIFEQYRMITGIDLLSDTIFNQLSAESLSLINNVISQAQEITTEVFLPDIDLWELLRYAVETAGNSNIISAELLESLGLYTNSVIAYLNLFGYIIQ